MRFGVQLKSCRSNGETSVDTISRLELYRERRRLPEFFKLKPFDRFGLIGMKELREKATGLEKKRDHQLEQYHNYEIASAILQIGIVLASAAIITSMPVLAWISGVLGIVGLAFMLFGFYAPELVMGLFEHGAGHAGGH